MGEATIENKSKGKKYKVHCINCANETNHLVLQSIELRGSEIVGYHYDGHGETIEWMDDYQIIQCQGCDAVSFRHSNWFSEYQDFDWDGSTVKVYPKRGGKTLCVKNLYNLPDALRRIYREVVDCFNNGSYVLCAAGLRSIVEGVCADQSITDGPVEQASKDGSVKIVRQKNLRAKILGLFEKGILSASNSETLHEHRYLGNEAVHELDKPSSTELVLAIGIIEHVLESLYEIPGKSRELKNERARRKSK